MKVAVTYMVPVTVFIDTETEEVERVLQENENIFLPDFADVYDVDRSWNPIIDEDIREQAFDIAEHSVWPVWDKA